MHPLNEKLITIARTQIGVHEQGGNNCGPVIVEYQKATWIPPSPEPWCAAFMCWVMREWMKLPEVQEYFKMSALKVNTYRCRYPSAYGWIEWANKMGFTVLDNTHLAKAGDYVVYNFSHIGLISHDQVNTTDKIQAIEGNTNKHGKRDSVTGDLVLEMERDDKLVKAYIRLIA